MKTDEEILKNFGVPLGTVIQPNLAWKFTAEFHKNWGLDSEVFAPFGAQVTQIEVDLAAMTISVTIRDTVDSAIMEGFCAGYGRRGTERFSFIDVVMGGAGPHPDKYRYHLGKLLSHKLVHDCASSAPLNHYVVWKLSSFDVVKHGPVVDGPSADD